MRSWPISAVTLEGQLAALADAAIAGVPVLDRRYVVESMTPAAHRSACRPTSSGRCCVAPVSCRPSRPRMDSPTVLFLPLLLPILAVVALIVRLDSPARCSSCRPASGGAVVPSDDQVFAHDVRRGAGPELHDLV